MKKVIAFIRVSTEGQSFEDQHREMEEFIVSEGYPREGIIFIEDRGASAVKLNQKYLDMIEQMKKMIIQDPEICCVAAWHLNRVARREEAWVGVKTFLVERGIQLMIKNPYLKLLTPEGKVDSGIELAAGLLAILAKQENYERMEKVKRAKKSIRLSGKWQGGPTCKLGYCVDADKYIVPDPETSGIIRLIFDLYSTGKYSMYSLARELENRGIRKPNGAPVERYQIADILSDIGYAGEETKEVPGRKLPAIISRELFDKCAEIRKSNKIITSGKEPVLASMLIKCPVCGNHYVKSGINYRCCGRKGQKCSNDLTIRTNVIESLVWRVAVGYHTEYLINMNAEKKEKIGDEIIALGQKITTLEGKSGEDKKIKVLDLYVEGLIDKAERDRRLGKIEKANQEALNELNQLKERKFALERLLKTAEKEKIDWDALVADIHQSFESKYIQYDIIHEDIREITLERMKYKNREGVKICITTKTGYAWEYLYLPMAKKGPNLYEKVRSKWVADRVRI